MKVLVTGARGQVGRALLAGVPKGIDCIPTGREEMDLADPDSIQEAVRRIKPEVIVNTAAYTAVDQAERESKLAYSVNAEGPQWLANAADETGAWLIHLSTDFVFDGKRGWPYTVDDSPNPVNVYGKSKLEGEAAVWQRLGDRSLIVRTAWVYAASGRNFFRTMLELMRKRGEVSVVDDQVGSPTNAASLADAIWAMIDRNVRGVHHWTDSGVASWYDFACAIRDESLAAGLLDREIQIHPIPSCQFPTEASRPFYTVLDKTATWRALGYVAPHWRRSLAGVISGLASGPGD